MRFTSSSTIAVRAAAAQPPQRVMALMSACTPALPNGSLPAMRKTLPVLWFWFIMLRTKVRLSFLPHKKRLRGIGRSQEQVKLTFRLLGESVHIANPLTLPFYLLPFYLLGEEDGAGRGKLTFRLLRRGKSIAHCKKVVFTFLPFTFLPSEGGRRTWKKETHLSVTGRGALHIANTLTLPFYLLPFYLLPFYLLPFYLLPFYLFTLLLSVNYINNVSSPNIF